MSVAAILINEQVGDIKEIQLDIDPKKNEIFYLLNGTPTFIGQWPELDVVLIKMEMGQILNENILPSPFDKEEVLGKILLVRMDHNSEPRDFTLDEYRSFCGRNKCITT